MEQTALWKVGVQVNVLPAGRVRARNDLRLAHLIERGLTAQFSGRLDCLYNRVHVVISAQMVGLDHGRIAPVRAREPYLPAARRLNQRRRDRETFFRRRSEPGRRFRRCDRELLKHQADVGRMVVHPARQIDLGLDPVAVRGAVGDFPPIPIDHAGDEHMVLQVLANAAQIGDGNDPPLPQLRRVTHAG